MEGSSKSKMERTFPQRVVTVKDDEGTTRKFVLRPIPLKMIRSTVFQTLVDLANGDKIGSGWDTFDLILDRLEDVLTFCLVEGSVDDLDMLSGPLVLQAFLDQNLGEGILGNWQNLRNTLVQRFPMALSFIPQVQTETVEKPLKKKSKKRKKISSEL